MKKAIFGFFFFVLLNAVLIWFVPKDQNNYYFAYQDKIERLQRLKSPRLIFLGGSSVAYSTDTKLISDSLQLNAVNMGLHAGIGIRFPMDDLFQYVRSGDIIVVQIEYGNMITGGNGDPENLPEFMVINDWKGLSHLNMGQYFVICRGLPFVSFGNFKRIIKYFLNHTWNHSTSSTSYIYGRDCFNDYGDEVLHYKYPNVDIAASVCKGNLKVSSDFIKWLKTQLDKYKEIGAKVVMLPPACIKSKFKSDYVDQMSYSLSDIGYPYLVNPEEMTLPDSCAFNTAYHMNAEGTKKNSHKIIRILRNVIEQ